MLQSAHQQQGALELSLPFKFYWGSGNLPVNQSLFMHGTLVQQGPQKLLTSLGVAGAFSDIALKGISTCSLAVALQCAACSNEFAFIFLS